MLAYMSICVGRIAAITLKPANDRMEFLAAGSFVAWPWARKRLIENGHARNFRKQILTPMVRVM